MYGSHVTTVAPVFSLMILIAWEGPRARSTVTLSCVEPGTVTGFGVATKEVMEGGGGGAGSDAGAVPDHQNVDAKINPSTAVACTRRRARWDSELLASRLDDEGSV